MSHEDRPAVPAAADGGVDDGASRDRPEKIDDVVDHDGSVFEPVGLAHPQPPDATGAVGMSPRSVSAEAGGVGFFHRAGRGAAHAPSTGAADYESCNCCSEGSTFSSHTCGLHSSMRSMAPTTSTSDSRCANVLR